MIFAVLAVAMLGGGQSDLAKEIDTIIARAAKPKSGDSARIKALGDKAFVRIWPRVEKGVKVPVPKIGTTSEKSLSTLIFYLTKCAPPKRTPEMTKLYGRSKFNTSFWIFSWLAETGEPKSNRSLFENVLKQASGANSSTAALGLARIGDNRAISVLSKALVDNKANRELMRDICWNLASIGKPAALSAVRAVLHKGRTLPKLLNRAALPQGDDPEKVLSTTIDSSGTKWALIKWDVLGAPDDLWIVRRSGNEWVSPVFTATSTYWPRSHPGGFATEGYEKQEKEMTALIEGKGWTKFIGDAELKRDTDGDSYADVIETWLGLDPGKADTDGDGMSDSIDKNPFAAPHAMSDHDKAMQAAMALVSLTDAEANRNKLIGYPDGVTPFEVESSFGPVYLSRLFAEEPRKTGRVFGLWFTVLPNVKKIAKDGSILEVSIQESGGYYEHTWAARVQKFGDEWFCVQLSTTGFAIS